jgi:hypothetical protein
MMIGIGQTEPVVRQPGQGDEFCYVDCPNVVCSNIETREVRVVGPAIPPCVPFLDEQTKRCPSGTVPLSQGRGCIRVLDAGFPGRFPQPDERSPRCPAGYVMLADGTCLRTDVVQTAYPPEIPGGVPGRQPVTVTITPGAIGQPSPSLDTRSDGGLLSSPLVLIGLVVGAYFLLKK